MPIKELLNTRMIFKKTQATVLGFILIFLIILMTIMTRGKLLHLSNLQAVAFQLPLLGTLTLAQMIPMITGGIDLSIISTANLSGIIMAFILTKLSGWYTTPLAIVVGVAVSLVVGVLNGILVAYISVPAIIATLGMMIFIRGVALVLTRGYVIAGFPDSFVFIGNGDIFGIPMPFIIFFALILLMLLILNKTRFGFNLYMLGSNITATEFSGVNVKRVLFNTHLLSSLLAGVASIIMISRFNAAQADYGQSYLLLTVLACVLGGVNPAGGYGKVMGVFASIVVLQVVATGFNLLGFSSHLANALWGLILLIVMLINRMISKAE